MQSPAGGRRADAALFCLMLAPACLVLLLALPNPAAGGALGRGASAGGGGATPVPVVIDTDIGNDYDDSWAIAYVLSRRDLFDLKLITTATGNATNRALLTCAYLEAVGAAARVPVGAGIGGGQHFYDGVGPLFHWVPAGYSFARFRAAGGTFHPDGVAALEAAIEAHGSPARPLLVIALSPLSNLGDIFTRRPELKASVVLATMGGSLRVGYDNSSTPSQEYNIAGNVSAAQAVYRQDDAHPSRTRHGRFALPICGAPLDTTWFFQIYGAAYRRFFDRATAAPTSLAGVLLDGYRVWLANGGGYGGVRPFEPNVTSSTLYDLQAAMQAGLMASRRLPNGTYTGDACASLAGPAGDDGLVLTTVRLAVMDDGITKVLQPGHPAWAATRDTVEATAWAGGQWNGSFGMGESAVAAIVAAPEP